MADKPQMSEAEKAIRQEIAERKMQQAADAAYNKVMPSPEPGEQKPLPMPKKMAKGGTVSSRADGIAARGKTRGRVL
jgi:carbamate kinase